MNFIYRSVKTRSEADVNIPDFEIVVYGVGMMYPEVKINFLVDEKFIIYNDTLVRLSGRVSFLYC